MQIGEKIFQMEGACFGLSTPPYWWKQVMNVFLKKKGGKGFLVFIYLDDILAKSKDVVKKHLVTVLTDLKTSCMSINQEKSML